ncbi:major facilitator superfamily domain-containing protein [Lasiosphaeria hispida]|uniref:Major facilitator superfamily domain-containing protein n=1 Tax=Lasiosphaeria hispida TaxID=260671 RepID=A0AAJ0HAG7_9PEZI|nr:major facilitator superfamily domain-containing protein [Lasiosphaeria hispida]
MDDTALRPVSDAPRTPPRSSAMRRTRPDTPRPATSADIRAPVALLTPAPAPEEHDRMLSPNPQIWNTNLDSHPPNPQPTKIETRHTWSFWLILASLSLAGMLVAIEGTILTNALPTIMQEIGGESLYFWVVNAFSVASVSFAPLYGHLSILFGRRWVMITAVALFTLGSGICGGAKDVWMLIAGRAIQGLGAGGINLLIEHVLEDLVPGEDFTSHLLIVMTPTIGAAASGSLLGGIIASFGSWRWVFYIHVPIGALTLTLQLFYLRTEYRCHQSLTVMEKLRRVDVLGTLSFLCGNLVLLLAPFDSAVVAPGTEIEFLAVFTVGFTYLCAFLAYQIWLYPIFHYPSAPMFFTEVFSNRTSAAAIFLTFILSICTQWAMYFLPIYSQAVFGRSPYESGLETLPFFFCLVPFAMLGVVVEQETRQFKYTHLAAFSFMTWASFQLTGALGLGLALNTLLPAVLMSLPETMGEKARETWRFTRGFGKLYAFTLPSLVFNNRCAKFADGVSDAAVAAQLRNGLAYQSATAAFSNSISDPAVRDQVFNVFREALRVVWYAAVGFAVAGLLAVFFEKNNCVPCEEEHREEDDIEMENMPRGRRVRTPSAFRISEA